MLDARQPDSSNISPAVKAVFDQIGVTLLSEEGDHTPDEIDAISERLISEALLTRTERREAEELARSINGRVRRLDELHTKMFIAPRADARRKARAQARKDKRSRKVTRRSR